MLNYKTDCRKKLFQWLDEYKIITVRMCRDMFYYENKYSYENARQFLKRLEHEGILKSYDCNFYKRTFKVYCYPEEKELKFHEVYQYFYMSKLKQCGMNFIWKHDYFKELVRPDLVIAYTLNNKINVSCIEIDYTHPTNIDKIKKYEYLVESGYFLDKWEVNPSLVIISSKTTLLYESDIIKIHQLDYNFTLDKIHKIYQL